MKKWSDQSQETHQQGLRTKQITSGQRSPVPIVTPVVCCNCSLIIKLYRHCMRFLCSWYPLLTSHWHICFSLMEILYLDLNASVLQVEMFIFRFSAFAFLIKTYTSELYMSLCSRCYHNFNKPHMLEGYYKYHKLHIHLPHFSKGFQ